MMSVRLRQGYGGQVRLRRAGESKGQSPKSKIARAGGAVREERHAEAWTPTGPGWAKIAGPAVSCFCIGKGNQHGYNVTYTL